ncbi:MAG TPA: porin, partial [Planctomycetota bacterium]|nr:porin [Planctomycetota bacterium]
MNKLVFGALALTLTSTAGFASDNEWLSLDQEIDALASSLTVQGGAGISGWIGARYLSSSDLDTDVPPDSIADDTGDFQSMARLNVAGSVGDYGYKISLDSGALAGGLGILDAYVTFPCGDAISTTFGQFKSPYSRSGLLSGNRLLFQNRTTIGAVAAT